MPLDISGNCPEQANEDQADKDVDGASDSVLKLVDACELMPGGETIDPATGCSIAQLVPCEAPLGSSEGWKNHCGK